MSSPKRAGKLALTVDEEGLLVSLLDAELQFLRDKLAIQRREYPHHVPAGQEEIGRVQRLLVKLGIDDVGQR